MPLRTELDAADRYGYINVSRYLQLTFFDNMLLTMTKLPGGQKICASLQEHVTKNLPQSFEILNIFRVEDNEKMMDYDPLNGSNSHSRHPQQYHSCSRTRRLNQTTFHQSYDLWPNTPNENRVQPHEQNDSSNTREGHEHPLINRRSSTDLCPHHHYEIGFRRKGKAGKGNADKRKQTHSGEESGTRHN